MNQITSITQIANEALKASDNGKLTGYILQLQDGREFKVERSNGFVMSGFCWTTHEFVAVDLRNDEALVIALPAWLS